MILRVRNNDPAKHAGKNKTVRIAGVEFIGRFLQHVLPSGFKRIRHYGLLAAAHKAQRLGAARAALQMPAPNPLAREAAADFMRRVARIDIEQCPHCHARWRLVQTLAADACLLRAIPLNTPTPQSMPQGP